MTLATTINKADRLVQRAAECHARGKPDESIEIMLELREHMNEPITDDPPGEDNTSENCKLCGKPQIA